MFLQIHRLSMRNFLPKKLEEKSSESNQQAFFDE